MEIVFYRTAAEEAAINKMKRKLDAKKINIRIFIFFALGLSLLVSERNTPTTLNTYIGFFLLGVSSTLYYQTYLKGRHNSINSAATSRQNNQGASNTIKFIYNETDIAAETLKKYISIKWSAVQSYGFHKDYLLILTGTEYKSSFVIRKSDVSATELEELLFFLSTIRSDLIKKRF